MDVNAKLEERGRAVTQMRELQAKAKAEGSRSFTTEEADQFDKLDKAQEEIRSAVEAYQKGLSREAKLKDLENETRSTDSGARPQPTGESRSTDGIDGVRSSRAYNDSFRTFLLTGQFNPLHGVPGEQRATLQADSFALGGAMLAPMQFVGGLIKALDDELFIRQWATKHRLAAAQSLGAVSIESDPGDADWTAELKTISTTDMSFGRRQLHPHPLTKGILASTDLLNRVPDSENVVRSRMAYKFRVSQEKAFLTGSGTRQPLGVFTASDDGISTARDVAADNTATEITGNGLIEAKHSLKASYWKGAKWVFSRTALKQIRKIKDSVNGNYIWVPGLQAGVADRILDVPYVVSEYAPATFTSGLYVGIIGDFSYYWIADALDMTVQRLVELYAMQRKVGFIGALSCDGMPVLGEAFARVKLG